MIDTADLISYAGIEAATGVPSSKLRAWRTRGKLPPPIREDLGQTPIWDRNVILPAVRALVADEAQ